MALDLLSVAHVNVNCSDLERSLHFYRDLVGLTPTTHTRPMPQEGAGFGLPGKVVWDAYMLQDSRAPLGPSIDLLEWQTPKPVGAWWLGFKNKETLAPSPVAPQSPLERYGRL